MNGNSTDSFGKYQMQSSSSEMKSKIVIEKLNGIVEPNVSPGKKSSSPVNDQKPSSGSVPAPKPNMIAVKHKPGPAGNNTNTKQMNGTAEGQPPSSKPQPPVNMIQVKKAPGKTAPAAATTASEQVSKAEESNPAPNHVKKKVNRIESSSSDSDSSDSDSSSSSSDDETTSQTSKSGAENGDKSKSSKPSSGPTPASAKPGIMNNKRKADDSTNALQPAKKRGRPPGTATPITVKSAPSAPSSSTTPSTITSSSSMTSSSSITANVSTSSNVVHSSHPVPGLPPLALINNRQGVYFSQHKVQGKTLNIFVYNDFQKTSVGSLHKVAAHATPSPESPVLWDLMLPAAVSSVLPSDLKRNYQIKLRNRCQIIKY